MIGHLQSNKAAKAVEVFSAIDSVDSLRLAEKLNGAAATARKRLPAAPARQGEVLGQFPRQATAPRVLAREIGIGARGLEASEPVLE